MANGARTRRFIYSLFATSLLAPNQRRSRPGARRAAGRGPLASKGQSADRRGFSLTKAGFLGARGGDVKSPERGCRAARPGGRFGFSWPAPFRCQDKVYGLLDFLGFPWILSSETRLINGLRAILAAREFRAAFPARARRAERAPSVLGMRKGRTVHAASLARFLILSINCSFRPVLGRAAGLCARAHERGLRGERQAHPLASARAAAGPQGLKPRRQG